MINRRSLLAALGSGTALALIGARSALADGKVVNFISWGGTTQAAQEEAWIGPFTEATGIKVAPGGPSDYGKLQAMVEAGNVTWDVVDVEHDFGVFAGNAGLLEKLDFSIIDRDSHDPRFVTDYTIGSYVSTHVLGFVKDSFDTEPAGWADLFDLEKFPGKRAYYKWVGPGLLEVPLLADGVKPEDLYPLDLDRAFKKLDEIKSQIVWYSSGAESQQLVASGETKIGMLWSGRLWSLIQDGLDIGISWDQNLVAADVLVVPKGTPNKEAAMRFLAYAGSAEGQARMANLSAYGPTNPGAIPELKAEILPYQPSEHAAQNVPLDIAWWAANRDAISARWYEWQAG
ncbi:ABC transporter substrate-binding protein [Paracoccus sp. IB05]|uniref:ABC transporter substrate-binding protein n=1 Tax=Paracoccus sp. IB05 TaxID=2779367 RepID=UPI0018E77978|nr:ABC transporter substrate-binding protein [Paracoccus sp. IB05]MBJ2153036.1 ABC transporter substrate-binding protein [Paracoccus sp. IB05]